MIRKTGRLTSLLFADCSHWHVIKLPRWCLPVSESLPYLVRLSARLLHGLSGWEAARSERHRRFVLSHQQPDGGFRGREGGSDLYYTAFAVRTLELLGGLTPAECRSVSAYLQTVDWRRLHVIDLMNWLSIASSIQLAGGTDPMETAPANWRDRMLARLEQSRRQDGGYAKTPQGAVGSTYHSFLVLLTYQLLGADMPRPNQLIQFLYDMQRDDGGFVEIAPMRRSGTNPTAAAATCLSLLGALDEETCQDIAGFLSDVRGDEGGFQANSRIPFADSLSTFTGLLTVQEVNCPELVDRERLQNWVTGQLEFPTGGFRAAAWDEQADIEYTFYGLGVLALLGAEV